MTDNERRAREIVESALLSHSYGPDGQLHGNQAVQISGLIPTVAAALDAAEARIAKECEERLAKVATEYHARGLREGREAGLEEADTELLLLRRESANPDRIRTLTDARNAIRLLLGRLGGLKGGKARAARTRGGA